MRGGGEASGHAQCHPKPIMVMDTDKGSEESEDDEEDTDSPEEETAETMKGKGKTKAKAQAKGKGKATGTGQGKGKGKGKETVPGKGKEGAAVMMGDQAGHQAADNSKLNKYRVPTVELDHMDGICARALFTYTRINLFQLLAVIVFGEWNKRPAVESKA